MNYESPAAFRMALETRLAQRSRDLAVDLNRLRRRTVFERVLVRLDDAGPGSWVLKGGMALEMRWRERARSTRDLDLAARHLPSAEGVQITLAEALARDPHGDWFQFLLGPARDLSADVAGRPGWRYPLEARLAGRQFAQVTVDVVERAEEILRTERVRLPGTLSFAGIPDASVETVDRDQHFAEKLHALTRTYGRRPNTRFRDLVDLVMLIEDDLQPTSKLHACVVHVFAARATHELPVELPDPPLEWSDGYAMLAADLDLGTPTIDQGMTDLRAFWNRVRSTERS